MKTPDWVKEIEENGIYYILKPDGKIISIDGYINHILVKTLDGWY